MEKGKELWVDLNDTLIPTLDGAITDLHRHGEEERLLALRSTLTFRMEEIKRSVRDIERRLMIGHVFEEAIVDLSLPQWERMLAIKKGDAGVSKNPNEGVNKALVRKGLLTEGLTLTEKGSSFIVWSTPGPYNSKSLSEELFSWQGCLFEIKYSTEGKIPCWRVTLNRADPTESHPWGSPYRGIMILKGGHFKGRGILRKRVWMEWGMYEVRRKREATPYRKANINTRMEMFIDAVESVIESREWRS